MIEQETVPCETCGEPTTYTGTKRCNNCYEVESRLDRYLQHPKAWALIVRKIRNLELHKKTLQLAREDVLNGHIDDIRGWITANELDELRAFLNSALNLDRMTLGEIRARFEGYIDHQVCPHGEPLGDCTACDVAGDFAYDAAREDRP